MFSLQATRRAVEVRACAPGAAWIGSQMRERIATAGVRTGLAMTDIVNIPQSEGENTKEDKGMSDVERLTANNQARVRYAEELAEARAERYAEKKKLLDEAYRYERKRIRKQTGSVICHMAAGWICGGVGYLAATGKRPEAVFAFALVILAMVIGAALDDAV